MSEQLDLFGIPEDLQPQTRQRSRRPRRGSALAEQLAFEFTAAVEDDAETVEAAPPATAPAPAAALSMPLAAPLSLPAPAPPTAASPHWLFDVALAGAALVEASAGTGKTWSITGLYVRLLLDPTVDATVEQILVVTFTKAATAELRERLRRRLGEAIRALSDADLPATADGAANDRQALDEFCQALIEVYADADLRQAAIGRLRRALGSFDNAAVFTIHGFCQRVLAEHAFASGTDFSAELVENANDLLTEVVDDFWRNTVADAPDLLVRYLEAHQETPDLWLSRVRFAAGRPDIRQVAPGRQALTPTLQRWREAWQAAGARWRDSRNQIMALLPTLRLDNRSYKPNQFSAWQTALDTCFSAPDVPLDWPDALQRFGRETMLAALPAQRSLPDEPFFALVDHLQAAYTAAAVQLRQQVSALMAELLRWVHAELPRRKAKQRILAFDDLLLQLSQRLASPAGASLRQALRSRFRAALIDEFQDTDPQQYQIFRTAFQDAGVEPASPLIFVGDPKQAIYSFRGADVFAYLAAKEDVSRQYELGINRRSAPELVAAVNTLFAARLLPFVLPNIAFHPVGATPAKLRLTIADESAQPFRFWLMPRGSGRYANKEQFAQSSAQAAAGHIAHLLDLAQHGGATLGDEQQSRPLGGGDIAVLVDTNQQGRLMRDVLLAYGVPCVQLGQDNVFSSFEAEELERVLAACASPGREALVKSALTTTLIGLGIPELQARLADDRAWEAELLRFQHYHEHWATRGFMPMFEAWFAECGVGERLAGHPAGERRLTNLRHLAELIQVQSTRLVGLDALVNWFARARREQLDGEETAQLRLETDAERVKIMTVHKAKGLEFPVVYCPFLWNDKTLQLKKTAVRSIEYHDDDLQPTLDWCGADDDWALHLARTELMAERLRLTYVALTRAKFRCYVAWGLVGQNQHLTPLFWLLNAPPLPAAASAEEAMAAQYALRNPKWEDIQHGLATAQQRCPSGIAVDPWPLLSSAYTPLRTTNLLQPPLQLARELTPSWSMTSFTGLTSAAHSEAPDYDAETLPLPQAAPPGDDIFGFPRGARPGVCLHSLFETIDFADTDPARLQAAAAPVLQAHHLEERWSAVVGQMLRDTLTAPLEPGLRLCRIPAAARRVEMEFTFRFRQLAPTSLADVLADPAYGLAAEFRQAVQRLNWQSSEGLQRYMKGFIDLVFEAGGRYYIVDYKSNWLGDSLADYQGAALTRAIARDHYYLQYLIYSVALHRMLAQQLPDYDPQRHLGGIYYLFLRGMRGDRGDVGIFRDRPSVALLHRFDALLA